MKVITYLLILLLFFSCQDVKKDPQLELVEIARKELELQPSEAKAGKLLETLSDYISNNFDDYHKIRDELQLGVNVSKEYGLIDRTAFFLFPILRHENDSPERRENLLLLGDIMINLNKKIPANIIYNSLLKKNPSNPIYQERYSLLADSVSKSKEPYMEHLLKQVVVNPDHTGMNRTAAMQYVDAAEAYTLSNPTDKNSPDYLFKAAEVARSLRTMPKAMSIYDWILDNYSDHNRAPTVLFIKAFILEQEYEKYDEAEKLYNEFLQKYPEHQLASNIKQLLKNLGKSEEEILKQIQNRESNSNE